MHVEIKKLDKKGNATFEYDEEWLEQLREEAQATRTGMKNILMDRLLPEGKKSVATQIEPMPKEFVKRWVRFPYIVRSSFIEKMRSLRSSSNTNYIASQMTSEYKNDQEAWDEDLASGSYAVVGSPFVVLTSIVNDMKNLLVQYGAAKDVSAKNFDFACEERIPEFVDNDIDMGDWWGKCYGREETPKPEPKPESEPKPYVEEEDTFDF